MTHTVTLTIPEELANEAETLTAPDSHQRMSAVIQWSRENVARGEGPFAAGVFRLDTGECIAAGVNRVLSSGCSVAHAEMMAILMAQTRTGCIDLSEAGPMVLTSSAQPCSQCFGGIPWSGVQKLEFGADRASVEAIGFDEGPCSADWREQLISRGIQVEGPIQKDKAAEVLKDYATHSGTIY
jgi:tRNA(Arg) A34 adenosine deaminase TadA